MSRNHIELAKKGKCDDALASRLLQPPDFVLKHGQYRWLVHSDVLAAKSKFFEKICYGAFKESGERVIELHDECLWSVAIMIFWFYLDCRVGNIYKDHGHLFNELHQSMATQGSQFSDFHDAKATFYDCEAWEREAALYILADKYEIELLTQQTREEIINWWWESCMDEPYLEHAANFMGADVLSRDRVLLTELLNVRYCSTDDPSSLLVEGKIAFADNAAAMEFVEQFVKKKASNNRNHLQQLEDQLKDIGERAKKIRGKITKQLKRDAKGLPMYREDVETIYEDMSEIQEWAYSEVRRMSF